MNEVIEYLVQALCSLTREEKVEVINRLLKDAGFREVLSEFPIKNLVGSQDNQEVKYSFIPDSGVASRSKGKKERGKQLRRNYISKLQQNGVLIKPFDNIWAETAKGLLVAIPTANMEWRPGRWFLGLPEAKVRERISKGGVVIILLCQSAEGSKLDFVIPPNIVETIVGKLSKSKGQLKFNVKTVGNRYYLVIPGVNDIDISDYRGGISILQV
jgi:hypothetical protein